MVINEISVSATVLNFWFLVIHYRISIFGAFGAVSDTPRQTDFSPSKISSEK